MTREETTQVLSILKTAYPKFYANLTKESALQTIELWSVMFANDPLEVVKVALYKLIATSVYPPSIADIRKAMVFVSDTGENDMGRAWGEVIKAVGSYGYMREQEALESMTLITRRAVESMGWKNICQSENLMADRAHFFKIYQAISDRVTEDKLLPSGLKEKMVMLQNSMNMALLSDGGGEE